MSFWHEVEASVKIVTQINPVCCAACIVSAGLLTEMNRPGRCPEITEISNAVLKFTASPESFADVRKFL